MARLVMGRRFLFRLEVPLRRLYSLAYLGHAFFCPVCEGHFSGTIRRGNDKLCPRCGSLARHRRLIGILQSQYHEVLKKGHLLDISPARSFRRAMIKRMGKRYRVSDLNTDHYADFRYDLAKDALPRGAYDLIICYHVLEHITDDRAAMANLYRAMKNGGVALVQTPFAADGEHREDPSITGPQERLRAYGQEDHVRVYSTNTLAHRLKDAGFGTETIAYAENPDNPHMQLGKETMIICTKA